VNTATDVDVDYIHSFADHQIGLTDRNLPARGPIDVATNPRPVPQFGQVLVLENFSKSWYDAWKRSSGRASAAAAHSMLRIRCRAAILDAR
jgi:hypothetical protein